MDRSLQRNLGSLARAWHHDFDRHPKGLARHSAHRGRRTDRWTGRPSARARRVSAPRRDTPRRRHPVRPSSSSTTGFRGGVHAGADLLDPFLPVQLTGAEAPISHTAYQGIVLLICATVVAARQPKARPWLAGAIGFIALSFGPWLYFQGRVLEVQGAALAGPAGVAMLAVPLFGRLTRWYRAGAVATLMLAPWLPASRAPQHRALLAVALIADVLLCAPLLGLTTTTPCRTRWGPSRTRCSA